MTVTCMPYVYTKMSRPELSGYNHLFIMGLSTGMVIPTCIILHHTNILLLQNPGLDCFYQSTYS